MKEQTAVEREKRAGLNPQENVESVGGENSVPEVIKVAQLDSIKSLPRKPGCPFYRRTRVPS